MIITARNSAAVSYSVDTCAGVDLGGGGGGGGGGVGAHRGLVPPPPPPPPRIQYSHDVARYSFFNNLSVFQAYTDSGAI